MKVIEVKDDKQFPVRVQFNTRKPQKLTLKAAIELKELLEIAIGKVDGCYG